MEEVDGSEILAIPRHICEFTGTTAIICPWPLKFPPTWMLTRRVRTRGFDSGRSSWT